MSSDQSPGIIRMPGVSDEEVGQWLENPNLLAHEMKKPGFWQGPDGQPMTGPDVSDETMEAVAKMTMDCVRDRTIQEKDA